MPQETTNPYRRFTLTLGVSVLLIGLALCAVSIWTSNGFVTRETVSLTEAAISKHFAKLPQLGQVFVEADAASANDEYAAMPSSGGHRHDQPAERVAVKDYDALNALIRMHFDLYSITDTAFYYPDGLITFSYHKDEVGQMVPDGKREGLLQAAHSKRVVSERLPGHMLHLWIPVLNGQGQLTGLVELTRDITAQDRQIGWLEIMLSAVILLGMLALFFGLRQVFVASAKLIDGKNRELGRMVAVIERTYDESLQALSSALDSRDNETQGHSFRVTSYALRLGQEMRLSERELGLLARGALLHDVGKIGVPDAILLKPDRLTEDEWNVMRSHVAIGYQMLRHITFLEPSLDVVRYHHERWDGKGYPFQLEGEQIPLYARIFAVCDTYDAMTSDRPYRKGRSCEEARQEIARCAGTQFCPEVAEAFLRIDPEEWGEIRRLSQAGESEDLLDRMLYKNRPIPQAG